MHQANHPANFKMYFKGQAYSKCNEKQKNINVSRETNLKWLPADTLTMSAKSKF